MSAHYLITLHVIHGNYDQMHADNTKYIIRYIYI